LEPVVTLRDFPKHFNDPLELQQSDRAGRKKFETFVAKHPDLSAGRFKDHGNGTVTDPATGLMWEKSFSKQHEPHFTLEHAREANRKRLGGHGDWRLPTAEELVFLYLSSQRDPGVPMDFPTPGMGLWTGDATPTEDSSVRGYAFVMFIEGLFGVRIDCRLPAASGRFSTQHVKVVRKAE
jgi:hypothetical protein